MILINPIQLGTQMRQLMNSPPQGRSRILQLLLVAENFGTFMCRIMQVLLVVLIFILFYIFSLFFLNNLFNHYQHISSTRLISYFCAGVFLLYNLIYNYVMAHRIGPGHPDDIPDKLLRKQGITKRCKKCNGRKPVRSHHCSICDSCNLQMDHHCPWMGTCIGHFNRRFFIKFLTYLTLSSFIVVRMVQDLRMERDQAYMFLMTIVWIIGAFTLFHWGLMLIGRTTLQFCDIMDGYEPQTWNFMHNFEIVFGTRNVIQAMLPVFIELKYLGYEWNIKQSANRTPYIPSEFAELPRLGQQHERLGQQQPSQNTPTKPQQQLLTI